jgi:hypothetical protein
MPANFEAVPKGISGTCVQDTLETSMFALNTLPACYGPAHMYPTPLRYAHNSWSHAA